MRKRKYVFLGILSFICIIFLVYSNYYSHLIEIKSHRNAIKQFCDDIIAKSKNKKFSGTIEEIKHISGPTEKTEVNKILIPLLTVNLLRKGSPFEMVIAPEEYAKKVKKIMEMLKGSAPDVIKQTIVKLRKREKRPDYETEFTWDWMPGKEKKELQLVGKIKSQIIITSRVVLTAPKYEDYYKQKQKHLQQGNKISFALLILCFVYSFGEGSLRKIKQYKVSKGLPEANEKMQEYIQNGRYVAAEKLVKHLLNYLPDNTDLTSITSRLDIITKRNTRKAEESFVRFNNLKTKYEKSRYLAPEEWEELEELPKYLDLPELNVMAGRCQRYIEMTRMGKALKDMRGEVKSLLVEGKIQQAHEKLKQIEKDSDWQEYQENISKEPGMTEQLALPGPKSMDRLKKEVDEKIEKSRKKMIEAGEALDRGDINDGEGLLREVRELNRELKEPEELLDKIENSRRAEKLVLSPRKTGKEIVLFKKDVLTMFRKEKKTPDIDISSKRVSRDRHLKLSIVENKVIAEDMGSSGGVYYRGEKIQRIEVENGGILDLSHSYRVVVHILRGREMVQSTLVDGTVPAGMKISAGEIDRSQKVSGLFLETDDKNYIVILTSVPVGIKSIGITYEKASPYELIVNEGIFIFKTKQEARILYPGSSLEERGVVYQIT